VESMRSQRSPTLNEIVRVPHGPGECDWRTNKPSRPLARDGLAAEGGIVPNMIGEEPSKIRTREADEHDFHRARV